MKRIILICTLVLCLLLCSCAPPMLTQEHIGENKSPDISMFIVIEVCYEWSVVYHKDTKVMYVIGYDTYSRGHFTLLVNADGTPMVYGDDMTEHKYTEEKE